MLERAVRGLRSVPLVALLLAAALLALVVAPARADDAAVPDKVRTAIEDVLKDKASKLADEKDGAGYGYKRGTYSKAFHRVDDTTYLVAFFQDTIQPAEVDSGRRLLTERFELTLKQGAAGKWSIAKEEKKDEFVGLYQGVFGGKWIYKFDALSFEKEGLKVTSGPGYAYAYRAEGKNQGFRIFSDDLNFEYEPPPGAANMNYYQALDTKLAREHPDDWKFRPDYTYLTCDPGTCDQLTATAFTGFTQVTAAEGQDPTSSLGGSGAAARLKKKLEEDYKDSDKARKENPFGGFDLPLDPDERAWDFVFHRGGVEDYYFGVSYDNLEPWQVSVGTTKRGRVFAYYSEDVRKANIDPHALEEREDRDALDYELQALDGSVELGLDDPTEIQGDITYTIHIKRELQRLPFFIARVRFGEEDAASKAPKLFINSVQDEQGNDLTWTRFSSFGGVIGFPKPIPSGTVMKLRLQFQNYDAIYQLNPSFFGLDRSGWLPFVRFTDQIEKFALTTRIKTKYTLLGIGKKVSESTDGDVRTERWESPSSVTFPTLIFGDYISDDAGKYQATKLDGTVIPVRVYVDKGSTHGISDSEGANAGARDIRGKSLQKIATQASVALNLYRDIYGIDYPYAKLDLVADPLGTFYGQSPASIIYLGFGVFRSEGEVVDYTNRSASQISKFNKDVVAHETAHQWWGSLVSNANGRNYWFVESLAELSSSIYVERVFGKKKYEEKVADWRNNILDAHALSTVQNSYELWGGPDGFRDIQSNIYNKGPYAFAIFRSTFGDEKFFQLLKELAQKLAHKEIVTRDIQDIMEGVVGGNMDWFFDQWIRGVGLPQYAINWTKRRNEQGKWIVEGTIKQRVVFGKDKTELPGVYYRGVAPLTFVDANGKESKTARGLLVQGPETPFRVIVPDEPYKVYFNKDGEILAEDTLVNQSW
jgi:Peptidase family M1 domain